LLQILPYPEKGEFANVGVLVGCLQPCPLHFQAERTMPARLKAMFPHQKEETYGEVINALQADMEWAQGATLTSEFVKMNSLQSNKPSALTIVWLCSRMNFLYRLQ
jgi:hypothetical protein